MLHALCIARRQPLNSPDLPDSGVPGWADEYIRAVRWEHLLDLIEAAGAMRIQLFVRKIKLGNCNCRRIHCFACFVLHFSFFVTCTSCVCRLVFLGCARIAAAIMRVGVESLAQALGVQDVDADAAGIDSKSIKMQNEWAWKEKDCPAVAPPSST